MSARPWWHPAAEPPDQLPSTTIGNVTIRAVRRGGMGIVLLGEDSSGVRTAVKRLSPEIAAVPDARRAFLHEAFLWISLGAHPNIVHALWAVDPAPESPMVGSEHIRDSLRDVLDAGTEAASAARLLLDVVHGLRYASDRFGGFAHGDLKPENVLVTPEGRAKIGDFGLSRAVGSALAGAARGPEPAASTDSQVGLRGTPAYMAPEQIRGDLVPASDVYALGCIGYELLTGRMPYGRPTSAEDVLLRHLFREPDQLKPGPLTALVLACLEKDPANRPTLAELRAALSAALEENTVDEETGAPSALDTLSAARGLAQIGYARDALSLLDGPEWATAEATHRLDRAIIRQRALLELREVDAALAETSAAEALLDDAGLPTDQRDLLAATLVNGHGQALTMRAGPGDLQEAIGRFAESARLAPASRTYGNLALAAWQLGERDLAIDALGASIGISADIRYYQQLVMWLGEEGRHDEAITRAEECLARHGDDPVPRALRSFALFRRFQYAGILDAETVTVMAADLAILDELRDTSPFLATVCELIGSILARAGHPAG